MSGHVVPSRRATGTEGFHLPHSPKYNGYEESPPPRRLGGTEGVWPMRRRGSIVWGQAGKLALSALLLSMASVACQEGQSTFPPVEIATNRPVQPDGASAFAANDSGVVKPVTGLINSILDPR